jgi:uncharacterized LabA/DUF88 family protein
MKVWVYIDGFNLYNGILRGTSYKWLDPEKLSYQILTPGSHVEKIKYFTAKVNARPNDPNQPLRQMVYWRALKTLPSIEIIEGHFAVRSVSMPTVASVDNIRNQASAGVNVTGMYPIMERVYKSEEKGTDVNLATHLVHDAHKNEFDTALIISNDSDLKEAIRITTAEIGKVVGIVNPSTNAYASELRQVASFHYRLITNDLAASQFPDPIVVPTGNIIKPSSW